MNIQTLKGFRDFLPQEAKKRQYVITTLKRVFESFGFEPLETPTLEYEEVLTGKYGDEGDKLLYRFEDNGQRKVAMRYDQTVPLARVVAQYANILSLPFKRYQIQNVWRAENTQKGRYREFMQCDIDTVGSTSPLADVEIIGLTLQVYKQLGFTNCKILLNDRAIFNGLSTAAIIAIDKLKKIGKEGVCKELVTRGIAADDTQAKELLASIANHKPTERIEKILSLLEMSGIEKSQIVFTPTLARGLDYYTGSIIEVECPDYPVGSLAGGGRYDNLIGMFAGKQIPAVGLAIGFDRTIEAMEALNLFPQQLLTTQVLVTIFTKDQEQASLTVTSLLRTNNINTEIWLGEIKEKNPLEKQLKYADTKKIPYVIIIGPEEAAKNMVTLKDLTNRKQSQVSVDGLLNLLQTT